jgi:hypothetical protein
MFEIGVKIENVTTLALEMLGAFALTTLLFQIWTCFAPVEVSTSEAWRWRFIQHRSPRWMTLLRWWVLAALSTFLRLLLYGVQMDVFVGQNSTVSLCGEEFHAVVKYIVETHLLTIFVKFLQDLSAQSFVGRRFERAEENECVVLFFSQLFQLVRLLGRFASID